MKKRDIRVLIVDDSAVTRQIVSDRLNKTSGIRVISTATDPVVAEHKINRDDPDVIVLDLNMAKMSGLEFMQKMYGKFNCPVVVFSSHAREGNELAKEAMELGALGVVAKPRASGNGADLDRTIGELSTLICTKVKAKDSHWGRPSFITASMNGTGSSTAPMGAMPRTTAASRIIAIGASTGGTDAIRDLLSALPADSPPIVVVIHMPEGFTAGFACRLNKLCQIDVIEARGTERLRPGLCVIAPGNYHLVIKPSNKSYLAVTVDAPAVNRHRPSVEVLFRSVAVHAGSNALGIMLTGMGTDGAEGMVDMYNSGAYTIAQDEESSVIFGMPKEAIRKNAVRAVLPLSDIAQRCVSWMNKR